jgi:hypothetical protein
MRRESATVVGLTGQFTNRVLAELDRSGNVSIVRAPVADPAKPDVTEAGASPRGWESGAPAVFEANTAEALAAWRHKKFELPDYYLVAAQMQRSVTSPDFYLGPLRALRPRRVAVAGLPDTADAPAQAALLLDALRSLEHGPWWPPLDELLDAARGFYAGALAETSAAAT